MLYMTVNIMHMRICCGQECPTYLSMFAMASSACLTKRLSESWRSCRRMGMQPCHQASQNGQICMDLKTDKAI